MDVLLLEKLSKSFGTHRAVDALSLEVKPGEIYGFLGPNGAGKTTTIKMIMGILAPTSGAIFVSGKTTEADRPAANALIGYLPDAPTFYDFLTGMETVAFVGEMHGLSRQESLQRGEKLLERFGLAEAKGDFAVNYSMGMKKKLGLACALVHGPKLLVLDEPTNGLDPRAAKVVQDFVLDFAQRGGSVFLSTHLLEMAEKISHRILVINGGRKVAEGKVDEVIESIRMGGSLEEVFLSLTETSANKS